MAIVRREAHDHRKVPIATLLVEIAGCLAADRSGYSATASLQKLKGFSRENQIDFIKKGMSAAEKSELFEILDRLPRLARTVLEREQNA